MKTPPTASSFAVAKATPDGVFKVFIASEGLAPERSHLPIRRESIQQLVDVLEGLVTTIRKTWLTEGG